MAEPLIYEIPRWFSRTIAALGGVVFIYLVFQMINFFLNRQKKKVLNLIRTDLKRIEHKIDKLKKK